jgi:hypothetical protein
MAFPILRAERAQATFSGNATSHDYILNSLGWDVGDIIVIISSVDGNPTVSAGGGSTNNDWVKLGQASNGTVVTGAIFYRIATESKAVNAANTFQCSYTASEQSSFIAFVVRDAIALTGDNANGSSTNSNPPLHTPPNGAKDYLWIATRSGDSTVQATAAPTNYTDLETQAGATNSAATAIAIRFLNAASEDPETFTSASEQWVSWTLAIEPATNISRGINETENVNDSSNSVANYLGTAQNITQVQVVKETTASTSHEITFGTNAVDDLLFFAFIHDNVVSGNPSIPPSPWDYDNNTVSGSTVRPSIIFGLKPSTGAEASVTLTTPNSAKCSFISFVVPKNTALILGRRNLSSVESNPLFSNGIYTSAELSRWINILGTFNDRDHVVGVPEGDTLINKLVGETDVCGIYTFSSVRRNGVANTQLITDPLFSWRSISVQLLNPPNATEVIRTFSSLSENNYDEIYTESLTPTDRRGSSFLAPSEAIKSVLIRRSIITGVQTLTLEIRGHTGTYGVDGKPTATVHGTAVGTLYGGNYLFEFASPITLTQGDPYFLLITGEYVSGSFASTRIIWSTRPLDGNNYREFNDSTNTLGQLNYTLLKQVSGGLAEISESVPLTDSTNGFVTQLASVTESQTATDTTNSTRSTSGAIAETVASTDSITGVRSTLGAVTESGAVADTNNGTRSTLGAVAESGAVADTVNGIKSVAGAITESGAVADTLNSTKQSSGAISETGTLVDTETATKQATATVTETGAIQDSTNGAIGGISVIQESVSIIETTNGIKSISSVIIESGALADSLNSQAVYSGQQSESVTLTDSVNGLSDTSAQISETIIATDSTDSGISSQAEVIEAVSITDTIDATVSALILAEIVETEYITDAFNARASGVAYAVPSSTIASGSWTPVNASTLWEAIDELTADDNDYIRSTGTATVAEVLLSSIPTPSSRDNNHTITFRHRNAGSGGAETIRVQLYDGANLIWDSGTFSNRSATFIERTATLTLAQANVITDYANLRFRFTGVHGATETVDCSQAIMSVPTLAEGFDYLEPLNEAGNLIETTDAEVITSSESVIEAGSALDSVSATRSMNAVASEVGNALDSTSGSVTSTRAIIETVAILDSVNSQKSLSATVQESLSATDSTDGSSAQLSVIQENGAVTDSVNASKQVGLAVVAEAVTLADSVNFQAGSLVIVSETGSLADSVSSTANFKVNVSEAGAAQDSINAEVSGVNQVTENITLSDSLTATVRTSANVTETGTLADVLNSQKSTSGLIAEALSIQDATNRTARIVAVVTENHSLADTVNGFGNYLVSVQDAGALMDLIQGDSFLIRVPSNYLGKPKIKNVILKGTVRNSFFAGKIPSEAKSGRIDNDIFYPEYEMKIP